MLIEPVLICAVVAGFDPEPKLVDPEVMAMSSMVTPNPDNPNIVPPIPKSPNTFASERTFNVPDTSKDADICTSLDEDINVGASCQIYPGTVKA